MTWPLRSYEDELEAWMPPSWMSGDALVYVTELFRPLGDLDLTAQHLYEAEVELSAALGWHLDVFGERVGEPRGGLSDTEYARIIAGRRVASAPGSGAVTYERLWAGWSALTGLTSGAIETTSPGVGYIIAHVDFAPLSTFIVRARPVWRAMLPAYRVGAAIVAGPDSLILNQTPLGAGVLAQAIA